MRRWLALSTALFIAALSCLAQAQAPNVRAVIFPPRPPAPTAASGVATVDSGAALLCASGTTCSYTNLTITPALANSALAVFVINSDNGALVSGLGGTWNGTAITQVSTITVGNFQNWIFGLLAPSTVGNTLALSWTGTARLFVCAVSLKNVTQVSTAAAFANTISTNGSSALATVNVTSQLNDLVLSVFSTPANWLGTSGSQICLSNGGTINDVTAAADTGSATVTATATLSAANSWAVSSIDVVHN